MGELYNPFPKLPKNIRQIGDPDQVVKLYVEDYVNTYLKRLYPAGSQTLRVGLLLGNVEQHDGTPYLFVDGAMEMEDVEINGEKIIFSESAWKKAYQKIEEFFPKRTVQGWFLCGGPGSQLSPLNYWKQHGQYFTGKNQLMYLNHGLDGEESIYITSEDGFYRLKGYSVYYERNQMMQDYMITRKDVRRIETNSNEKVVRDFRQKMQNRKEQAVMRQSTVGALGMLCGLLSVAVLAGGVVLFNNYQKMQRMESVLTSVLPANAGSWDELKKEKNEEPDFIIEEIPGNVRPTEPATGETGEYFEAGQETMAATSGAADEGAGKGQADAGNTADGSDAAEGNSPAGGAGDKAGAAGQENAGTDKPGTAGQESAGASDAGSAGQGTPESVGGTGQVTGGASIGNGADKTAKGTDYAGVEISPAEQGLAPNGPQALVGMGKGGGEGDEGGVPADKPAAAGGTAERPPIDYEAAAANGYRIYEVGEGETLYGICWRVYGDLGKLREICKLNYLEDEDKILAGQKLILP